MSGHAKQQGINVVAFLLFSIAMSCTIFAGLLFQEQPDVATVRAFGLALITFGVVPHSIGLNLLIKQGKTISVIVVSNFLGFWSYAGIGLLLSDIINYHKPLLFIEAAIIFFVAGVLSWYWVKHKPLVPALVIIILLVAHLWTAKVWWLMTKPICPYAFLFTGVAAFATGLYEAEVFQTLLKESLAKKKKKREAIERKVAPQEEVAT